MESQPIDPDDRHELGCCEAIILNRMREVGVRVDGQLTPEMMCAIGNLAQDLAQGYRVLVCQKLVPYKGPSKGMVWTDGEPEDGPIGTPVTHFNWQTYPPNGKESK